MRKPSLRMQTVKMKIKRTNMFARKKERIWANAGVYQTVYYNHDILCIQIWFEFWERHMARYGELMSWSSFTFLLPSNNVFAHIFCLFVIFPHHPFVVKWQIQVCRVWHIFNNNFPSLTRLSSKAMVREARDSLSHETKLNLKRKPLMGNITRDT